MMVENPAAMTRPNANATSEPVLRPYVSIDFKFFKAFIHSTIFFFVSDRGKVFAGKQQ